MGMGMRPRFERLNPFRVRDILLVSSPYDQFMLEEEGLLTGLMAEEYDRLNLTQAPRIMHASDAVEALDLLRNRRFDLVISLARLGSMKVHEFGRKAKAVVPDIPVVLLAYNTRELATVSTSKGIDHVFVWSGDSVILLAIAKLIEDEQNLVHDVETGDVQIMLLVEDSPRFYSTYLPRFYSQLVIQTSRLMYDGFNLHDKMLRLRARAKILLAKTYEEAIMAVDRFGDNIIGLFTDGGFPRQGRMSEDSGLMLVEEVRKEYPFMPILFQSTNHDNEQSAIEMGATFIPKDDPTLHKRIRKFMRSQMSFGDFIFRTPEGAEIGRATNLVELRRLLPDIPMESLLFHAERNHFSHWLRTRSEFDLASKIRHAKVDDFDDVEGVREFIYNSFGEFLKLQREREVFDFNLDSAMASSFQRLGTGSLGGKGRGLAFFFTKIGSLGISSEFPGVDVDVPRSIVIATDVFEDFLERNQLTELAYSDVDDEEIAQAFLESDFTPEQNIVMERMLEKAVWPLAVRSSSLLEDALHQPFAGVYSTFMLPNDHPSHDERVRQLSDAVKLVYASTFYRHAKAYVAATPNSIEEERMAVVIQELVGTRTNNRFYPDIAGVARSHNHYPIGPIEPEDGLAALALGLGRTVAEGEKCLRVSPAHPTRIHQFANVAETLRTSQHSFWAVKMNRMEARLGVDPDSTMIQCQLDAAMEDGKLGLVASTFVVEDDRIVDSVMREGPKVITMHGVLKREKFPLMPILQRVMKELEESLACPVEIEFAVAIDEDSGLRRFSLVQLRPLVADSVDMLIDIDSIGDEEVLMSSDEALGNGIVEVRDVIVVSPDELDRLKTRELVPSIEAINGRLSMKKRPYLLIGPGRWGSSDPSLGIPVNWAQISGAATIVECDMADIHVEPSQGTHFFQNIVSFGVGYLTIPEYDEDWFAEQHVEFEYGPLKHYSLQSPLRILIDSRTSRAVVKRPSSS